MNRRPDLQEPIHFTYQVTDDEGDADTATVSIVISDMVWFVDNSSSGGSDLGTFNDPFTSITSFNSAQGASAPNPTDGDVIFVYQGSGNYTDGINLRDSQVLLGQGIDLLTELGNQSITLSSFSDLSSSPASGAGNRPILTDTGGNGIDLASGNTIKGLNVGNTSGIGVTGASVGNLTIDQVGINGTNKAFDVDGGGTLSINLDEVAVSSSSSGGFSLQNASGSTTIANVNITTTGGTGLLASSAGTFTVTGSGNQVDATSGTAVNIANTTIGNSGVTFESISASGTTNGIVLNNTGTSSGFTVTGDGDSTVNGSGGSLTNISGDAVKLTDTKSFAIDQLNMSDVAGNGILGVRVDGLSIRNGTFNNIGDADPEDVFSFDRDVQGDNGLVGTALFQNLTITNFAERAIDIVNEGSGTLDLDILNVSADNNNDTFGEDAIRVQTEGSVNADVLVSGGTYNNLELDVLAYFAQGTGTNMVEMTGVTSTNGGGPDNNPNGGGVAIVGSGGSTTSFDINANSLTNVQGSVVQIIGLPGSGQIVTLNGTIGGANLADANTLSTDLADGIDLDFDGDGAAGSAIAGTILVQNNTINFDDDGIGVDHRDAGGTMNVIIRDNTLNAVTGDDASLDADDGIFIFIDDDIGSNVNQLNLEIFDNTVSNLTAGKHVIVVEDVQDGNNVCFAATGNSNNGGNGDIELDTDAQANLVVDANSAADLSTLNNNMPVTEAAPPPRMTAAWIVFLQMLKLWQDGMKTDKKFLLRMFLQQKPVSARFLPQKPDLFLKRLKPTRSILQALAAVGWDGCRTIRRRQEVKTFLW